MTKVLRMIGVVNGQPIKISDPSSRGDAPGALDSDLNFKTLEQCLPRLEQVEKITKAFFSAEEEEARIIMANNIILAWSDNIYWTNLLLLIGDRRAKELNIPSNRVFVASTFASLIKALDINFYPEIEIRLVQQPFKNKSFPLFLWAIYLSFENLFSKSIKSKRKLGEIGFSACWGLKNLRRGDIPDLFWWREQHIPQNRLSYMFNRPDFPPTIDRVREMDTLGIKSVSLDWLTMYKNSTIPASKKFHKPLFDRVKDVFFSFKLFFSVLFFDDIQKSATAFLIRQYAQATKMASYYRFLNLKGLLENSTIIPDYFSLAASFSGAVRFGYQVSCLNTISYVGLRVEPVNFLWGKHDARVYLESGAKAKYMLISGCIPADRYDERARKPVKDFALDLRKKGAKFILSFFDNSFPPFNFYRSFLKWLLEDPDWGLLIKSKGHTWSLIKADGLDGLVEQALKTGRLYILPSDASPADAAIVSDFSVGYLSYSAIVASAVNGARILFLENQEINETQKPYCTFHSFGPDRCVFYDFDSMKRAVQEYISYPQSNPMLGDVTPVLDDFDPFRDGKAGERIGEYISWYLRELDKGVRKDDALKIATQKYANKWGADKVICGL